MRSLRYLAMEIDRRRLFEATGATSYRAVTSERLGNIGGRYFEDCDAVNIEGRGHMQNKAMAARLMQRSTYLTAEWLIDAD